MLLEADQVSVEGTHGALLHSTSLRVSTGTAVLVAGLPGVAHTTLALALTGRIRPDGGTVRLDGRADARTLRRRVAVVDTPGVSEPDAVLPLHTVVREELAMAGQPSNPRAAARWLTDRGAAEYEHRRFEHLPASPRLALLLELACLRPGVGAVVLTAPDRHGGPVEQWWRLAQQSADAGRAVVVTATDASAELLGVTPARIGGGPGPRAPAPAPV